MNSKRDTGLTDIHYRPILEGDKVEFCGYTGEIMFIHGTWGISVEETIEHEVLQAHMDKHEYVCCGNTYNGCHCDNFISLWELGWNFNCFVDDNDALWILEVIQ